MNTASQPPATRSTCHADWNRARGSIAVLATIPIAIASFSIGFGVGSHHTEDETRYDWAQVGPGEDLIEANLATYTASQRTESAPATPSEVPVGASSEEGVTVAYVQFTVEEDGFGPDHTYELVTPFANQLSDTQPTLLEATSVQPDICSCNLTADVAPRFGPTRDSIPLTPEDTEATLDVTDAIDGPGKYAFAITITNPDDQVTINGLTDHEHGPTLRVTAGEDQETGPQWPIPFGEEAPGPRQSGTAPEDDSDECTIGANLVPTCGTLVGVAPAAHTGNPRYESLLEFEETVQRPQDIHHAYERADEAVFPNQELVDIATEADNPRLLFINWKPQFTSWADIASGNERIDAYLDELATHLTTEYTDPFFFTIHHEPENDVQPEPGSGWEASDYADMYRYVIEYLRDRGVDNLVTVMNYMAYLPWVEPEWHADLYPGDDIIDWMGWSTYGHSVPDRHGFGDFADIVNRTEDGVDWPGYYHWSVTNYPDKPIMLAEWGVFYDESNPDHPRDIFHQTAEQIGHFPRLEALVYFDSPSAEGRDTRVNVTEESQRAFQELMTHRQFDVELRQPGE